MNGVDKVNPTFGDDVDLFVREESVKISSHWNFRSAPLYQSLANPRHIT